MVEQDFRTANSKFSLNITLGCRVVSIGASTRTDPYKLSISVNATCTRI